MDAKLGTQPSAASITDSPWFWLRLFAYFAILALVVIEPKFARRQQQLEQKFAARQRAATPGESVAAAPAQPQERIVTVRPLLLVLLAILMLAESIHWRRRRHASAASESQRTDARVLVH